MLIVDLLHAVVGQGGTLPPEQFGGMTLEQLRSRYRDLEQKAADHDNSARLCRVAMASVETAINSRAERAA